MTRNWMAGFSAVLPVLILAAVPEEARADETVESGERCAVRYMQAMQNEIARVTSELARAELPQDERVVSRRRKDRFKQDLAKQENALRADLTACERNTAPLRAASGRRAGGRT